MELNLLEFYEKYKRSGQKIPTRIIKWIIRQIASGLSFIHSRGYMHWDIKPENILIDFKGNFKIADFGFIRHILCSTPITDYISTWWYWAPEILLKLEYDLKVDIFALGCVLAELLLLKPIFCG